MLLNTPKFDINDPSWIIILTLAATITAGFIWLYFSGKNFEKKLNSKK